MQGVVFGMSVFALIDKATGIVENRIELEPGADYDPGDGKMIVPDDMGIAQIGGRWTGLTFKPKPDAARAATPAPGTIGGAAFVGRVNDDELTGIMTAATTDPAVARFVLALLTVGRIDVAGDVAKAAKAALVSARRLTQQRADEIFAG